MRELLGQPLDAPSRHDLIGHLEPAHDSPVTLAPSSSGV